MLKKIDKSIIKKNILQISNTEQTSDSNEMGCTTCFHLLAMCTIFPQGGSMLQLRN